MIDMDDNSDFFDQMKRFFEIMQNEIANAVDKYTDEDGEKGMPQFIQTGFKIDIGPDGPRIQPIDPANMNMMHTHDEWEKPLTDVFLIDNETRFHIIAEVPGVEAEDVKFHFQDKNKLAFQAEFDQYKYKKGLQLKYPIDPNSLEYTVRNGVLEIFINVKTK